MITISSSLTKRLAIAISAAALMVAVTAVAAEPATEGAEARLLRQLLKSDSAEATLKQKVAAIAPKLEAEASRLNAAKALTAEERRQIVRDKVDAAAEHAADEATTAATDARSLTVDENPFFGIHEAADVPNDFTADEFVALTYWGGTVNGKPVGMFSGYRPSDPSHGVVVVMADKADPHGTFYDVVGAPSRIASVTRNLVTLVSATGHVQFDLVTKHSLLARGASAR